MQLFCKRSQALVVGSVVQTSENVRTQQGINDCGGESSTTGPSANLQSLGEPPLESLDVDSSASKLLAKLPSLGQPSSDNACNCDSPIRCSNIHQDPQHAFTFGHLQDTGNSAPVSLEKARK